MDGNSDTDGDARPPERVRRLCSRAEALTEMARGFLDPEPDRRSAAGRHQVVVHIDADVLAADTAAGAAYLDGGPALSAEQVARIACDAALVPLLYRGREILDIGRATRAVPTAIQRALRIREGGCRFPGCGEDRRSRLHTHHIRHWARGGRTALPNLVLLCTVHHRAVHQGEISLVLDGGDVIFRDRHGQHLPDRPVTASGQPPLPDTSERLQPGWVGERLDLDYAVSVLLDARRYRRQNATVAPPANAA